MIHFESGFAALFSKSFSAMPLDGQSVFFFGKLTAYNRKEAMRIVRLAGGRVVKELSPSVQILVVGEEETLATDWQEELDQQTRAAFETGILEMVPEAEFWKRCQAKKTVGLSENSPANENGVDTLYTPSMLAELTGVPTSLIRHLGKKNLLVPVRQIHRLAYFDHESIPPLKTVRNMLDAGFTQPRIIDRLSRMRRLLSAGSGLPSGSGEVAILGKNVMMMADKGPVNQDGQFCFRFMMDRDWSENHAASVSDECSDVSDLARGEALQILESAFDSHFGEPAPLSAVDLCETALLYENRLMWKEAAELYRTALAVGGPDAQIVFQLAEVLYQAGDLSGARERYFMAIELDEEFVEARANLGCVLAELGENEWAAAAFRGALKFHPDYAEVHFHLGALLHRVGLNEEAREHFRLFLELAPDSPWAERIPAYPLD